MHQVEAPGESQPSCGCQDEGDIEFVVVEQAAEGFEQPLHVLAWFDGADEQDEIVGHGVASLHLRQGVGAVPWWW